MFQVFNADALPARDLAFRMTGTKHMPRPPRLPIHRVIRIRVGTHLIRTSLIDISLGGAKILIDQPLAEGQVILLNFSGAPRPLLASVRWRKNGTCGLRFCEPLLPEQLDDLARPA